MNSSNSTPSPDDSCSALVLPVATCDFLKSAGLDDSECEEALLRIGELQKRGWSQTFPLLSGLLADMDCPTAYRLHAGKEEQNQSPLGKLRDRWLALGRPELGWHQAAFHDGTQSTPQVLQESSSCKLGSVVIAILLLLSTDCFSQNNHAPNSDIKTLKIIERVLTNLGVPVFDGQGVINLPLLKSQLDSKGLGLLPTFRFKSGVKLPLFSGQRLSMPKLFGLKLLLMSQIGSVALPTSIEKLENGCDKRGSNSSSSASPEQDFGEATVVWRHEPWIPYVGWSLVVMAAGCYLSLFLMWLLESGRWPCIGRTT